MALVDNRAARDACAHCSRFLLTPHRAVTNDSVVTAIDKLLATEEGTELLMASQASRA